MPAAAQAPELVLPALRQELKLYPGAPTINGVPTWMIHDPIRHRYFQLSGGAIELLRCWQPIPIGKYCERASAEADRQVGEDEVRQMVQYIFANNLSETAPDGNPLSYAAQIKGAKRSPTLRAVHGYLFFKVPLVRPDRFLRATMSLVAPLYTRTALYLVLFVTISGIYLASRQWDVFTSTFMALFSLEGALLYAIALVFIKTLHELGHAYTATRYGIRVNTMGVAFMVLMPLLFTDVSDAWRLTSRKKKLAIDAAGLLVELAIAGIATLLWVFLPDGPTRSAAFILATTSWILSVFVNVNPFMRFDGYYLLCDAWGIPNLQSRSFALARWRLREMLFGIGAQPPEAFRPRTRRWLIAYAVATWIYRLFLFIGIALIVYHMFFKLLGVTLFIVEIVWFIALPVWRELHEWWKLRDEIMKTRRTLISLAVAIALIALIAIPWSTTVVAPVTTAARSEITLFPSRASRLEQLLITDGQIVRQGDIIAVLHSEELTHQIAQTQHRIQLLQARLNRIAADNGELSQRAVLLTQLEAALQNQAGLKRETARLTLVAPIAGRIRDLNSELHAGRHIQSDTRIAQLVTGTGQQARGYVREEALWRLAVGAEGRFIPDDPALAAQDAKLEELSPSGIDSIDIKYLASVFNGPIASETTTRGDIKPRAGHHHVKFALNAPPYNRVVRGVIHIEGRAESIAAAAWRQILKVLVRESGI